MKDDVRLLDPKVEDFLKGSDNLLDDYEFAETDHRTIEEETESLSKRWNKVKSDASSRESRFVLSTVYRAIFVALKLQFKSCV